MFLAGGAEGGVICVTRWWCGGGEFLSSFGRGFFNLFLKKKRRRRLGKWDVVGETRAEKRPRGLWHSSASQEGREREKERRGERGVFFLQSSELECFNWHVLRDFACFVAVFPFSMRC